MGRQSPQRHSQRNQQAQRGRQAAEFTNGTTRVFHRGNFLSIDCGKEKPQQADGLRRKALRITKTLERSSWLHHHSKSRAKLLSDWLELVKRFPRHHDVLSHGVSTESGS